MQGSTEGYLPPTTNPEEQEAGKDSRVLPQALTEKNPALCLMSLKHFLLHCIFIVLQPSHVDSIYSQGSSLPPIPLFCFGLFF